MSKAGVGCLIGLVMLMWGSIEGIGFFVGSLVALSFLGDWIGSHHVILGCYILGVIFVNYVVPIVAWSEGKHVAQKAFYAIATPIVAFVVLAVPSSFVALGGCKAGNDNAVWAMRVTPVILVLNVVNGEEMFSCNDWR